MKQITYIYVFSARIFILFLEHNKHVMHGFTDLRRSLKKKADNFCFYSFGNSDVFSLPMHFYLRTIQNLPNRIKNTISTYILCIIKKKTGNLACPTSRARIAFTNTPTAQISTFVCDVTSAASQLWSRVGLRSNFG